MALMTGAMESMIPRSVTLDPVQFIPHHGRGLLVEHPTPSPHSPVGVMVEGGHADAFWLPAATGFDRGLATGRGSICTGLVMSGSNLPSASLPEEAA